MFLVGEVVQKVAKNQQSNTSNFRSSEDRVKTKAKTTDERPYLFRIVFEYSMCRVLCEVLTTGVLRNLAKSF